MERRGYVERRPDPGDARARLVYLSERGTAALAAARRFHQAYERRLARADGRAAVDALRETLGRMAGTTDGSIDRHLRALFL